MKINSLTDRFAFKRKTREDDQSVAQSVVTEEPASQTTAVNSQSVARTPIVTQPPKRPKRDDKLDKMIECPSYFNVDEEILKAKPDLTRHHQKDINRALLDAKKKKVAYSILLHV